MVSPSSLFKHTCAVLTYCFKYDIGGPHIISLFHNIHKYKMPHPLPRFHEYAFPNPHPKLNIKQFVKDCNNKVNSESVHGRKHICLIKTRQQLTADTENRVEKGFYFQKKTRLAHRRDMLTQQ